MSWKAKIKHMIPPSGLNRLLLACPSLYRTKLINYETNLDKPGVDDLLAQIAMVLHVEGNIIECGSSRCGASIIMSNYLRSKDVHKLIYACDSFEGFDPVELDKERKTGLTVASDKDYTSTSYDYVVSKIEKLAAKDTVIPIKGFFQDTLLHIKSKWCFALVDCDLKESIIYCAVTIWPNLMSNGRMVFDDYTCQGFRGARFGIEFFVGCYKNEISDHGLMKRLYYVCKK